MIRTAGRGRGGRTIRISPPYGHRPGDNRPDRTPDEFESLVAAYQGCYPDAERRQWIERKLRDWRRRQP